MGMQVNTNLAANNAYRALSTTQNDLSKSLEKLSSGLRINRAADDAAGLAISEGLKSQVGGLTVASRNAQDGISVLQTAEGSLNETTSILQRMRDLAVQAGNDSNNAESRGAIQTEVTALTKELTRISEATNFNGTQLLDGSRPSLSFQVGANSDASSQIAVDLSGANVKAIAATLGAANGGLDIAAGDVAAADYNLTNANGSTQVITPDLTAADLTDESATGGQSTLAKTVAALNQDSAFSGSLVATITYDPTDPTVETGMNVKSKSADVFSTTASSLGTGAGLDFSTAANAAASISMLDTQIEKVSTARAELGANQNRFESVIKNLAVSTENLTAAGSRIRDTDMAQEMVNYTRANILSQAGTAMLAQANQSNQGVLQLLR
ncbi:flagellin [Cryobacterium sp. MLB-32]|uniref:flagellin N-terminal helical domain-containing protein n=1 Tax=Cryobacterium sp. MLB-32 TaxID=1529318 RepID=UPI0004E6C752|nr:flagellin [Cryobacterium sp. MLB-32]KFF61084.1 flagellin [Cryobacterium sp. MLB-32]